jgi:hypothetical protein
MGVDDPADVFHVDANESVTGHSVERELMRMRRVEAKRTHRIVGGECGLAMRAVPKTNLLRFYPEITPEDLSEQPTRDNEVLTVPLEMKPRGSLVLIFRERLLQAPRSGRRDLQGGTPDVDFIPVKLESAWRITPWPDRARSLDRVASRFEYLLHDRVC